MGDSKKDLNKGVMDYFLSGEIKNIEESAKELDFDWAEEDIKKEKLVKYLKFTMQAMLQDYKDQELLKEIAERFSEALNKKIDKPINQLRVLISQGRYASQYRNLDELTIEDIKTIVKDHNLLELLEKLEKEK